MQIALDKSFQRALTRLDPAQQAAVNETILKLQAGNSSVRPHKLEDSGFVSIVVNRDALRIVSLRDGDTYVLLHVDKHDAAYKWATRHRMVQVGSHIRLVELAREQESGGEAELCAPPGPLAEQPDKVFKHFEVGPLAAAVLRTVPDDSHLIELLESFKAPVADAVLGLATEPDALQELVLTYEQRMAAPTPAAPLPLSEVISAQQNRGELWLLPPEHQALKAALEAGGDAWRVFLHPSQRKIVEWQVNGAIQVSGGPGTGKTVVLLHRARFLAESVFGEGKIVLCTFSRALAEQLERDLGRLCVDAPALLDRFEVHTLTGLAREVLDQAGEPSAFLDDEVVEACWDEALKQETLGKPRAFYVAEREGVCARNGTWSLTTYARVPRTGRGSRLRGLPQRKAVWKVLEAFEAALKQRGGGDAHALARRAGQLLRAGSVPAAYVSVLCDEVQDASADELRLLAAMGAGSEQTVRPNALFLCGDGYQRLYRSPVPLSACGIEIRGRSRKLRLNYRTTEGIRAQAVAMVSGQPLDELEESSGQDALQGYRSLRGGPLPEERSFNSPEEEADWVASLSSAADEGPLLVMARTKAWLVKLEALLVARGLSPFLLGKNSSALQPLTLCTLHRAKGLEAPRAVLVGMQQSPMAYRGSGEDKQDRVLWERMERSLVYVGMTRARDWCGVSRVG